MDETIPGAPPFGAWRAAWAAPLVALLTSLAGAPVAIAAPMVPADDNEVIERLPVFRDQGIDLRRLHAALARNPDDMNFAVQVARRDLDYGGPRFDPRYTGYAQAALAPWWTADDPPVPIRLLRATIRQRNHDFDTALVDLDAVLERQSLNAQALLTRASVRLVRAEYEQAAADCAVLLDQHAGLAAVGCAQAVAAMRGDPAAAYAALRDAYAVAGDASVDVRVWVLGILAETASRLGDPAAEPQYRAALTLRPDDGYVLAAFADFLLDRNRPGEVVALLAEQTQIDQLLLRLAIAEQRLGASEAAGHIADLADRFAASAARGETLHRREEARFDLDLLHQPQRALRLAVANWQVQREPADARVLLECALAARAPEAAAPVLAWLETTGFADPRLLDLGRKLRAGRTAS